MAENPGIPSEIILAKLDVTALVVLVPEAEPMVQQFRGKHDSVADGVPAHITILFPFMPPDAIDGAAETQLRHLFASHARFDFVLADIRRFPSVIYLAPEPAQPFVTLTESVVSAYPEFLPYEGNFPDITPHLTVAHAKDQALLSEIERAFATQSAESLPLKVSTDQVALMERRNGRWRKRMTFALS